MSIPEYEVYALRYGSVERHAKSNFLFGGDFHDGPMALDFYIWAIRGNGRVVVVDTGFSEATAAKRNRVIESNPVDILAKIGIDAAAVPDVIITHLHFDHAGNAEAFRKATFHIQDTEVSLSTGRYMCHQAISHSYEVDDVVGLIRNVFAGRVRFHDGDGTIAPGITVHKIGGHTGGLQVVRVNTARGWIVLASDATHYYDNIASGNPFPIIHHVGDVLEGFRKLNDLARSPDHIVPGHDPKVLARYPNHPAGDIACLHLNPRL
ncbi:MAG: N-acyl homoserine lactonase family protein [Bradyrhizobium sp.]